MNFSILLLLLFYFSGAFRVEERPPRSCIPKRYQFATDISCLCNSTYCDDFPALGELNSDNVVLYTSSMSGDRFRRHRKTFKTAIKHPHYHASNNIDVDVKIDTEKRFQTILGFGGAFTDAAGVHLTRLSEGARDNLLKAYFHTDGIEYTIGRVPMASCDFSKHVYSYCDTPDDFKLKSFNLTAEDFELKIPHIKRALSWANLSIFASPWSAPGWMKESGKMVGGGMLKGSFNGKYYLTWANYFRKFFEAYDKEGIKFWGLTLQNEPLDGAFKNFPFQSMYFTPMMQRDFVSTILGPTLKSSSLTRNLKIMVHDDQRFLLPFHADVILKDKKAAKYIDGIGVHWYGDFLVDAKRLSKTHELHPEKFILATEACSGYVPFFQGPAFGDWYRGEEYAYRIIEDLENWVIGWTDWNICLDEEGGPNFVKNFVDSPIIVNSTTDEFYKQPMYYALGHFSKFIRPGSVRLGIKLKNFGLVSNPRLSATAFLNPQGKIVLVVLNRHATYSYTIHAHKSNNKIVDFILAPNSISTIVWSQK